MSSSYTTEPPPNGRVTLETGCGPLDIFLFSNEAPAHCRHFLSLVQSDYFTSSPHRTIYFHRLVKDFVVQFGGPLGTAYHRPSFAAPPSSSSSSSSSFSSSSAAAAAAGSSSFSRRVSSTVDFPPTSLPSQSLSALAEQFLMSPSPPLVSPPLRPEKHSRLRFIHRGLLCHARRPPPPSSGGGPSTASANDAGVGAGEFFLTLSDTPTLDKEGYTIIGTVRGQTLFNLMRIAEVSAAAVEEERRGGDDGDGDVKPRGSEEETAGASALAVPLASAVRVLRMTVVESPSDLQLSNSGVGSNPPWSEGNLSAMLPRSDAGKSSGDSNPSQDRKKRLKAVQNVNVLSFGGDDDDEGGGGEDGGGKDAGGGKRSRPPAALRSSNNIARQGEKQGAALQVKTTAPDAFDRRPASATAETHEADKTTTSSARLDAADDGSDSDAENSSDESAAAAAAPPSRPAAGALAPPASKKVSAVSDVRARFLAGKAAAAAAASSNKGLGAGGGSGSLVVVGLVTDKEARRRKEEETLARLAEFQSKLKANKVGPTTTGGGGNQEAYRGQVFEEEREEKDEDWMNKKFAAKGVKHMDLEHRANA